jgi:pimeloyl-ACP methyl ester carboxylesterase
LTNGVRWPGTPVEKIEEGMQMQASRGAITRMGLTIAIVATTIAVVASSASANAVKIHRTFMPAPPAPGTPEPFTPPRALRLPQRIDLNSVGVVKVGPTNAKNVLVLEPGTSAGAGYFVPFAKSLTERLPGWQVWSVERRENLLEDQSELHLAKIGRAGAAELFRYYLGYLAEGASAPKIHYTAIPSEDVEFAREWGMNVAVEDLHTVIESAKALGGKVVLGGHSLGGSVVTAYATWDFAGKPGADGLSGLVYDDGGSSPSPVSKEEAEQELTTLAHKSPWLAFGGIPAPDLGLFSMLGSTATVLFGEEGSLTQSFPFLPEDLKPTEPAGCKLSEPGCKLVATTNEAEFGFGVNVGTSPPTLIAAQVHAGKGIEETAKEDGLHGWNGEGALTPLRRYAEMLSGTDLPYGDGSEWYFPERLTIDTGAVAEGNANPAQEVLDEHAIFGHSLPTSLKILAIDTELDKFLGAGNTLQAAEILAEQSGIPKENLTLINREETYSHNDPAGGDPVGEGVEGNIFFKELKAYLERL